MPELCEDALIRDVERRLIKKYNQLPPADVATVVGQAHATLADSRVRDFVPLLVERRAQRELTHCAEMLAKPVKKVLETATAGHGSMNIALSFNLS